MPETDEEVSSSCVCTPEQHIPHRGCRWEDHKNLRPENGQVGCLKEIEGENKASQDAFTR